MSSPTSQNPIQSNNYAVAVGTSTNSASTPILLSAAPTTSTIGPPYPVGKRAIVPSANEEYVLTSFSAAGGSVTANWFASGGMSSSSSSPFVVGPTGQAGYQTIQSAIDACYAAGGGTVLIQKGVYTENLLFRTGVALLGVEANVDSNSIQIIGTHIPPSNAGTCSFRNINFYSTTAIFSSTAAGQAYLAADTVNFILSQAGYVYDLPNWTGPTGGISPTGTVGIGWDNCGDLSTADSGSIYNPTGNCPVSLLNSYVGAGTGGTKTLTVSGQLQFTLCDIFCPVSYTGGTGNFIEVCDFHGFGVTVSGSSTGSISNTNFDSLSSAAITMSSSGDWYVANVGIDTSNNPAISGSGAGTLKLSGVSFTRNGNVAGTLTIGTGTSFRSGTLNTNGNLSFQLAGNKITSASVGTTTTAGANSIGSVTLVGGTATVSTTSVTTNSLIYIWRQSIGATGAAATGNLTVGTITNGVSFVINSVQAADATALQAADVSIIGWVIIN